MGYAAQPDRRITIQFLYSDLGRSRKKWWLVIDKDADDGTVDLCMIDPGHDIDLYIVTDLRTMTAVWMGIISIQEATRKGQLQLTGARDLESGIEDWLGLSVFAHETKRVRAE